MKGPINSGNLESCIEFDQNSSKNFLSLEIFFYKNSLIQNYNFVSENLFLKNTWYTISQNFQDKFSIMDLNWAEEDLLLVGSDFGSEKNFQPAFRLTQIFLIFYNKNFEIKKSLLVLTTADFSQIVSKISIRNELKNMFLELSPQILQEECFDKKIKFYIIKTIFLGKSVTLSPIAICYPQNSSEQKLDHLKFFLNTKNAKKLFYDSKGRKGTTIQFGSFDSLSNWIILQKEILRKNGYKFDDSSVTHLGKITTNNFEFGVFVQLFPNEQNNQLFSFKEDQKIKFTFGTFSDKEKNLGDLITFQENFIFYSQDFFNFKFSSENCFDTGRLCLTDLTKNEPLIVITPPNSTFSSCYNIITISEDEMEISEKFYGPKDITLNLAHVEEVISGLRLLEIEKYNKKFDFGDIYIDHALQRENRNFKEDLFISKITELDQFSTILDFLENLYPHYNIDKKSYSHLDGKILDKKSYDKKIIFYLKNFESKKRNSIKNILREKMAFKEIALLNNKLNKIRNKIIERKNEFLIEKV